MKYCLKCKTQNPKAQKSCKLCGSLTFCSIQEKSNETKTIVEDEIYYICDKEVTKEQTKSIEELIVSGQKDKAANLIKDISGLSIDSNYVDKYFFNTETNTNDSNDEMEDIPMPTLEKPVMFSVLSIVSFIIAIFFFDASMIFWGLVCSIVFIIFICKCISSISSYRLAKKDFESYRRTILAARKRAKELEKTLHENEIREQQKAKELANKRAEYRKKGIPTCPKCGSPAIATVTRGYSIIWGFIGSGKPVNVCQNCGHKWQIGK